MTKVQEAIEEAVEMARLLHVETLAVCVDCDCGAEVIVDQFGDHWTLERNSVLYADSDLVYDLVGVSL